MCTWFFNSPLLRLSRVIMLTYKITIWYDRVNIELTHRTSELWFCANSSCWEGFVFKFLSYLQWQPFRAGTAQMTVETLHQKAHGCENTMPKKKCFKGNCFACDYRKSFLCVPSRSRKYLVKLLQEHCHLPHLQHKSNYFLVTQKSAARATWPKSSYMKSSRNFNKFHPSGSELVHPSSKTLHSHSPNIIRLLLDIFPNLSRLLNC